jgi:preprotein translocase subunit SecF
MFVTKNKNLFLGLSLVLIVASIASFGMYGLKKSIDFTGGAKVTFDVAGSTYQGYPDESTIAPKDLWKFRQDVKLGINKTTYEAPAPKMEEIKASLEKTFGETKLTQIGTSSYEAIMRDLKESDYPMLEQAIRVNASSSAKIETFAMTGPIVSQEIVKSAIWGVVIVVLAIILFMWFAFRSVNRPVSSYKYGLITIATLLHDIIIPVGVFAWLGHAHNVQIDALFIVALLTIFGISIADKIVVFDRVRENLKHANKNADFEDVVGKSINETLVRSVATSAAVIIVLMSLVVYGPESTKYFALTLTIGMFVGTYSSIFVASPLLVYAAKYWKN